MLVFFVPPLLAVLSSTLHKAMERGAVVHLGVVEEESTIYYSMSVSDWESQPEEYKQEKRLLRKVK